MTTPCLGKRRYGAACLELRVSRALPAHMREKTRELRGLATPIEERNKGLATELMGFVTDEADDAGITLVLWVQPFGDVELGRSQLKGWYERRFGFQEIQAEPLMMARMPGSTPRRLNPLAKAMNEATL